MTLDEILQQSPNIAGYGGGKWAMYSIRCCWWTSFPDDLGSTKDFPPPAALKKQFRDLLAQSDRPGLPCCPHCGSVLLQAPLKKFIESARTNPAHYGHFGLRAFELAHSRNFARCYSKWSDYNVILVLRRWVEERGWD